MLASTNFHIHSILTLRPFVNNQGFYEEILLTSCHPISLEYELQNRRFSLYSNNSIFNNLFWTIFKWFSYLFELDIETFSIQSEIFNFLNFKSTIFNCFNIWGLFMDNGYVIRTKNHETSKVVGFLGMSVGCPDKIHLCWKKCSRELKAKHYDKRV